MAAFFALRPIERRLGGTIFAEDEALVAGMSWPIMSPLIPSTAFALPLAF
jgi:hypothetical protein